jgi:uncharacterized protein (DUF433 family)
MDYSQFITIEPGKRSGQPCIRGMRITVRDVLEYLASGMAVPELLADFPELTADDIRACLAFAASQLPRPAADEEYDDSPWTRKELEALAWERVKHEDWDEYDDLPEKP